MKIHIDIAIIILLILFTFVTIRACFQRHINVTQDGAIYGKDKYNTEHIGKMAGSIEQLSAFLNATKSRMKQKDIQEATAIGTTAPRFQR